MNRRTLITCVVLNVMLTFKAHGQATFRLMNRDSIHGVDAPIFDADGIPLSGTDYVAELWGGQLPEVLAPALELLGEPHRVFAPFGTDVSAGYFRAGETMSIVDVPDFGWAWLRVRAWDLRLGPTYEAVSAAGLGGYGESALFYAMGGSAVVPTAPQPLIGLESFSLRAVVPEPGTWALLLLGAPVVLWSWRLRRRCPRPSA